MQYLISVMSLLVVCNTGYALYPSNNYNQQQLLLKQALLQEQLQLLQQELQLLQQQQAQGQYDKPTNLDIILPKTIIDDFEYIPTAQGYRFSYRLPDGSRREENAFITHLRMDGKITDFTAAGIGGRPIMNLKNRKLSPGSLKALAG